MECQQSDSKKKFSLETTKRKRSKKKREGNDETNSLGINDSNSLLQVMRRASTGKTNVQDTAHHNDTASEAHGLRRDRDSSASVSHSPVLGGHKSRSTRRSLSLALKAGYHSTPRSTTPTQDGDVAIESIPCDHDSAIYDYLEEAIKRDKKKHRDHRHHAHRTSPERERDRGRERDHDRDRYRDHDRDRYNDHRDRDRYRDEDRERSKTRERRRHRCRSREEDSRENNKLPKDVAAPSAEQSELFEKFAKFFVQMNEAQAAPKPATPQITRTQSHKSLQCEVIYPPYSSRIQNQDPVKLKCHENSIDHIPFRTGTQENIRGRVRSHEDMASLNPQLDETCDYRLSKQISRYSKMDEPRSRVHDPADTQREYYPRPVPSKACPEQNYYRGRGPSESRDFREYENRNDSRLKPYDEDRRKFFDQKTSRSFDIHREGYVDDDRVCRRTVKSDTKDKMYDDPKRYMGRRDREKYYEEKREHRDRQSSHIMAMRERAHKNMERFDRMSIMTREEDFRDRCSEKGRDSGLSVADCDTSTISGKSNYLRIVKQEIAEQREAMDKMMDLWKDLMKCFKGMSKNQGQQKAAHETAATVRDSAATQLRLWRECMHRYETVARDVGDTDARLMEEITKQRSEMAEMSTMWQECLQRYRTMSEEFTTLKQRLVKAESPVRQPVAPAPVPLVCAEGEGLAPPSAYRLQHGYPPIPPYPTHTAALGPRSSAPPAWVWGGEEPPSSQRRFSPDSRELQEKDTRRRHKERDRDDSRQKDKAKPNMARSEHARHRRR